MKIARHLLTKIKSWNAHRKLRNAQRTWRLVEASPLIYSIIYNTNCPPYESPPKTPKPESQEERSFYDIMMAPQMQDFYPLIFVATLALFIPTCFLRLSTTWGLQVLSLAMTTTFALLGILGVWLGLYIVPEATSSMVTAQKKDIPKLRWKFSNRLPIIDCIFLNFTRSLYLLLSEIIVYVIVSGTVDCGLNAPIFFRKVFFLFIISVLVFTAACFIVPFNFFFETKSAMISAMKAEFERLDEYNVKVTYKTPGIPRTETHNDMTPDDDTR